MAELVFSPGHVALFVRLQVEPNETAEQVEARVVDWLGNVIGANPSRRTEAGEYVIGPANPVTVIPILGLDERELADRETRFCVLHDPQTFLGLLPPGAPAGAMVHLDWSGVHTPLTETRWFETAIDGWRPATSGDEVELAIVKSCTREDRARPPAEPPGLLDDVQAPHLPEFAQRLSGIGPAVLGLLLGWFFIRRKK